MEINQQLLEKIITYRFIYSMTGLLLGLAGMIGGMILFLHGVAGSASWTARILGNESTITDAAPGAILFIIGLFVVIVTRFRVQIDSDDGNGRNRKNFL